MLLGAHGWIPSLLERQLDTLELLLRHRCEARRDHRWSQFQFDRLGARLEHHVDALALAGRHADPFTATMLASSGRAGATAGARPMLRAGGAQAGAVWDALRVTSPDARGPLAFALRASTPQERESVRAALTAEASNPRAELAAIAAAALALDVAPSPSRAVLDFWRGDANPVIREAAWVLIATEPRALPSDSETQLALRDESDVVREAVYEAAGAHLPLWFASHCRMAAATDPLALRWWVPLTTAADVGHWQSFVEERAAVAETWVALGGTGLVSLAPLLLDALEHAPAVAIAALAGYARLTGAARLPTLPGPQSVDGLGVPTRGRLPDVEAARSHWEGFTEAGRVPADDRRSIWERAVRSRFEDRAGSA